jgi:hypothetical protein
MLYKFKISSGMNESSHHCPLVSVQTVLSCLFLNDLETQRFNFSWGNFGNFNHNLSSHSVMSVVRCTASHWPVIVKLGLLLLITDPVIQESAAGGYPESRENR